MQKLILLNDMGDVGGDWMWHWFKNKQTSVAYASNQIAEEIRHFANLNPQHIILLLTKNPVWYRLAEWPENVWCGFSATNNEELIQRSLVFPEHGIDQSRLWISCEPWLDSDPPMINNARWLVIGGLSGRDAKPVSDATIEWLRHGDVQAKIFTKSNAIEPAGYWPEDPEFPRDYPDRWRVGECANTN